MGDVPDPSTALRYVCSYFRGGVFALRSAPTQSESRESGMAVRKAMWVEMRARTIAFFVLALVVAASIGVLAAKPAPAATTFTVDRSDDPDLSTTTTADDCAAATANDCSLRGAITAANSNNNPTEQDTITFAIPGSGEKTIQVDGAEDTASTDLPVITEAVTIDGYTQPGASPNTNTPLAQGTNANLLIVLNGGSLTSSSGLIRINASDVVVKGLEIKCFNTGIFIQGGGSHAVIEGNFIGNNPAECSANDGVVISGSDNTIGGTTPAARNLISGNSSEGLSIGGNGGNTIQGNLIGTRANGTDPMGNHEGVEIASPNNTIGNSTGNDEAGANLIAFNGTIGVSVLGVPGFSAGNRILSNSIHSNGQLGIDLTATSVFSPDGVTKNDGRAKDRDTGANNLQNYPVLSSAKAEGTTTTIKGTLKSTPRKNFTIQFFSNDQTDPSGFGEGEELLYQLDVKTNRRGSRSFSFPVIGDLQGKFITATATNDLTGDTSEFSEAKQVTEAR